MELGKKDGGDHDFLEPFWASNLPLFLVFVMMSSSRAFGRRWSGWQDTADVKVVELFSDSEGSK